MKKVKCVRAVKVFRVDYEPGKVYEVDEELGARLLKHQTQVGASAFKCFALAVEGGEKKAAKKTATKSTKKSTSTKSTKKKSTKKKST